MKTLLILGGIWVIIGIIAQIYLWIDGRRFDKLHPCHDDEVKLVSSLRKLATPFILALAAPVLVICWPISWFVQVCKYQERLDAESPNHGFHVY